MPMDIVAEFADGHRDSLHFVSAMVDFLPIDSDGNVYAALTGEGRVMVFDPKGVPIGQILIPDRDRGEFLFYPHHGVRPSCLAQTRPLLGYF